MSTIEYSDSLRISQALARLDLSGGNAHDKGQIIIRAKIRKIINKKIIDHTEIDKTIAKIHREIIIMRIALVKIGETEMFVRGKIICHGTVLMKQIKE